MTESRYGCATYGFEPALLAGHYTLDRLDELRAKVEADPTVRRRHDKLQAIALAMAYRRECPQP